MIDEGQNLAGVGVERHDAAVTVAERGRRGILQIEIDGQLHRRPGHLLDFPQDLQLAAHRVDFNLLPAVDAPAVHSPSASPDRSSPPDRPCGSGCSFAKSSGLASPT